MLQSSNVFAIIIMVIILVGCVMRWTLAFCQIVINQLVNYYYYYDYRFVYVLVVDNRSITNEIKCKHV